MKIDIPRYNIIIMFENTENTEYILKASRKGKEISCKDFRIGMAQNFSVTTLEAKRKNGVMLQILREKLFPANNCTSSQTIN